jgi:hypothetical protein
MGIAYLSAFAAACPECWAQVDAVALHWVRIPPSLCSSDRLTPQLAVRRRLEHRLLLRSSFSLLPSLFPRPNPSPLVELPHRRLQDAGETHLVD